jgi:two-component system, NarL family, sensor histidine kinase DegS
MDTARPSAEDRRFDGLHAEAKAALGYTANSVRAIRDRYRELYHDELSRWHAQRDDLDTLERRAAIAAGGTSLASGADAGTKAGAKGGTRTRGAGGTKASTKADAVGTKTGTKAGTKVGSLTPAAATAAEAGAEDARDRALRSSVDELAAELAIHQRELSKLELAQRSLESTWLFLERGDMSLIAEPAGDNLATDVQMRIVEAQEAERGRLAQEVHDGPAQALTNAIFQVEYIERILDQDVRLARTEIRFLRDLLRRELGDVRNFITQLRPPLLDQLGLDGAIADAVAMMAALTGLLIEADLVARTDVLSEAEQTVVLRVVQEALQNVRKHAAATRVTVASRMTGPEWILEVRDDGRGFDIGAVAARGRRNFGLQFMRERAELIGARFEVRSRPAGGTVVVLAIPTGEVKG